MQHIAYPQSIIESGLTAINAKLSISPDLLITNIDESTAGTTYFGYAVAGSSGSSAVWKIWKLVESSGISTLRKADGNDNFDNVWDNRSSLTYS